MMGLVHPDLFVSGYTICGPGFPDDPFDYIEIVRTGRLHFDRIAKRTVAQLNVDVWKVERLGFVLNSDAYWEREPLPSERDEYFLARCRFPLAEAKVEAQRWAKIGAQEFLRAHTD